MGLSVLEPLPLVRFIEYASTTPPMHLSLLFLSHQKIFFLPQLLVSRCPTAGQVLLAVHQDVLVCGAGVQPGKIVTETFV
jgi:hypothetical protein